MLRLFGDAVMLRKVTTNVEAAPKCRAAIFSTLSRGKRWTAAMLIAHIGRFRYENVKSGKPVLHVDSRRAGGCCCTRQSK
jgi:hypothetical protein